MASISVSGLDDLKSEIDKEFRSLIKDLADRVETRARANTPIRSGNARKNWQKSVKDDNFTVSNRVPYIQRLEAGASKQAPRGIIGPTLSQIKGRSR
jgi:HK97 gp10 family phage protein